MKKLQELRIIKSGKFKGERFKIEGLWKDISGISWMHANANPACMLYAIRSVHDNLPFDDNVFYGKIDGMGCLIHESEL